jgi:hypothetical protein
VADGARARSRRANYRPSGARHETARVHCPGRRPAARC